MITLLVFACGLIIGGFVAAVWFNHRIVAIKSEPMHGKIVIIQNYNPSSFEVTEEGDVEWPDSINTDKGE